MSATERNDAERPLDFAIRHINASARDPIAADALLEALTADVIPTDHEHHVHAFFDEVEIETIADLARSGAVSYGQLARRAERCLAPGHETLRWLVERA